MGLKIFSTRQSTAAERPNSPQPVIDSDSLRQAALRASWHRDHRVSRRREAWRWVMFWVWKYGRKAGVLAVPIVVTACLALQFWPGMVKPWSTAVQTIALPDMPGSVLRTPTATSPQTPLSDAPIGIRLVPAAALHTGTETPGSPPTPVDQATQSLLKPLRLTPEIQTHPKESSP